MLQFRKTFKTEKAQMQELNRRLSQYLSRVKHLEQENACLLAEIKAVRRGRAFEWEEQYLDELRGLRRAVDQLTFQKSKMEMERDNLRRDFHGLQALLFEESTFCRDVDGELRACKAHLQQAQTKNAALEESLLQLEHDSGLLQDEHRREIARLQNGLYSGATAAASQTWRAAPAITVEEVEQYALSLSESCEEMFEVYRRRVEDLEDSIRADEDKLEDLQREKLQYATDFEKLRCKLEEESRRQAHLEDELLNMRDNGRVELDRYQMIIEELEQERTLLTNAIAAKLKEHQDLMQVKMSLGLEVATYRALLEGEQQDAHFWTDRYLRQAPRQTGSSKVREDRRQVYPVKTAFETKYTAERTSLRTSPGTSLFRSYGVPLVAPGRDYRSSSFQREGGRSPQVPTIAIKPVKVLEKSDVKTKTVEKVSTGIKDVSQHSVKVDHQQQGLIKDISPIPSPTSDQREISLKEVNKTYVRVVSPPMMSLITKSEAEGMKVRDHKADGSKAREEADMNVAENQGKPADAEEKVQGAQREQKVTSGTQNGFTDSSQGKDEKDTKKADPEVRKCPAEEQSNEMVSLEEIIEKVIKPAGLDTHLRSSTDSVITYHVEKTVEKDGKTQIILESKVEEDLDDSALEELLSKEVRKTTLEDVKGTPTGRMIENLLSFGLTKGGNLENKSVNIEIIEEPLEAHSDEESEPSKFIQIEELENDPELTEHYETGAGELKTSAKEYRTGGSVHIQEGFEDTDVPYFTQETEYFVSTPDDEPEEGCLSSSGHYGVVHDLSDERYYQEEPAIHPESEDSGIHESESKPSYMTSKHVFSVDQFPGCIIEEEIHISPKVQESMLEVLPDASQDPKEQLRGALARLQSEATGTLNKDLSFFTRTSEEGCDRLSVDIRTAQKDSDEKSMTIVSELNVSQTLEGSELLEGQGNDMLQEIEQSENVDDKAEEYMKLGPSEESFTFQADISNVTSVFPHGGSTEAQTFYLHSLRSEAFDGKEAGGNTYSFVQTAKGEYEGGISAHDQYAGGDVKSWQDSATEHIEIGQELPTQAAQPQLKVRQEERIIYVKKPEEA